MTSVTEMLNLLDDAHNICERVQLSVDANSKTAARLALAMTWLNEASIAYEQEMKL